MRRTLILGLCLVALIAFGVLSASAAQAAGPEWLVKGAALGAGAEKAITFKTLTSFYLRYGFTIVLCDAEKVLPSSRITGGINGQDTERVSYEKCYYEGHPECPATTPGQARGLLGPYTYITVLTYEKGKTGTLKEREGKALDAFMSEKENNVLFEFKFEGLECGALLGTSASVVATGTELSETIGEKTYKSKCGILGEMGKIEGSSFVTTKSGEEAVKGAIELPEAAISEAETLTSPEKFGAIHCSMEVSGSTATAVNLQEVELETKEEFGWKAL
jgi:hypothetical protein